MKRLKKEEKSDFIQQWSKQLALADPEGIGFTENDEFYYLANGGIFTYTVEGDIVYDLCTISLGPLFVRGFLEFKKEVRGNYRQIYTACKPRTSVEKILKRIGFISVDITEDNREVYKWEKEIH